MDALNLFTLISGILMITGSLIGYYLFEDFTGIVLGLAAALSAVYLYDNFILGISKKVLGL